MRYYSLFVFFTFFIFPELSFGNTLLKSAAFNKTNGKCGEVFYLYFEFDDVVGREVSWSGIDRLFPPDMLLKSTSLVKTKNRSDSVSYCHQIYFTFIDTGKVSLGPFPVLVSGGGESQEVLFNSQTFTIGDQIVPRDLHLMPLAGFSVLSFLQSLDGLKYIMCLLVVIAVSLLFVSFRGKIKPGPPQSPEQILLLKLDQLDTDIRRNEVQDSFLEELNNKLASFSNTLENKSAALILSDKLDELRADIAELRFSGKSRNRKALLKRCGELKSLTISYLKEQRQ